MNKSRIAWTALGVCIIGLLLTVRPADAQPPAPTLLSATAGVGEVQLEWTPPFDMRTTFRIEAGSAPGRTDLAVIDTVGFSSQYGAGNVPTGTYFVRVRAKLLGEISAPSNELVVTVNGCPPPVPPRLDGEVRGQTVDIGWAFGANPRGCYPRRLQIEAGSAPGLSDILVLAVPDFHITRRIFNGVPFGTYFVRARVTHPFVGAAVTNELRFDVTCLPPPPVPNIRASVVGNGARYAWDSVFGVFGDYTLSLEAGSRPGATDLGVLPIPGGGPYGVNVQGPPGQYFTRVRAVNACGTTVSDEVPLTLGSECLVPNPVPFLDASMVMGANTVLVRWLEPEAGGLVTGYDLDVGSAPGQADIARFRLDGRVVVPIDRFQSVGTAATRTYIRIVPRNACGAAVRPTLAQANVGVCSNPPAPRWTAAQVAGSVVTLTWSGTSEMETTYDSWVEIGRSPGASDVLISPPIGSYGTPSFSTTLPSGVYYARSRRRMLNCGENSNPSSEVRFVIP